MYDNISKGLIGSVIVDRYPMGPLSFCMRLTGPDESIKDMSGLARF